MFSLSLLLLGFLPRWATVLLGAACATLCEHYGNLNPLHAHIRLGVDLLALCGFGLLAAEALRRPRWNSETQERMHVLVEMSPAAIVTIDERGAIDLANRAAVELLAPRNRHLVGRPIAGFPPPLPYALRWDDGPRFRALMRCRGHRDNGQPFLARVWFSGSKEGTAPKVAAIIAEISTEQLARPASPSNA